MRHREGPGFRTVILWLRLVCDFLGLKMQGKISEKNPDNFWEKKNIAKVSWESYRKIFNSKNSPSPHLARTD
jgi:hypothetical protein